MEIKIASSYDSLQCEPQNRAVHRGGECRPRGVLPAGKQRPAGGGARGDTLLPAPKLTSCLMEAGSESPWV